jgi:4-carboxymuconolactone decarboxylase
MTAPRAAARRLPLRTSQDTAGETQRVLRKLEASRNDLDVIRTLANSPQMLRPFVLFADALMHKAALPARVREIVILALAADNDCAYEWTEHDKIAAKTGVNDAERAALRADGLSADIVSFSDGDRLALRVTAELHPVRSLSDASWQAAVDTWGPEGAIDLVLSVGWWGGLVPTLLGAVELPLPGPAR